MLFLSDLVEFTDEEGYGKYLDLHECYVKFINLRGIEVYASVVHQLIIDTNERDPLLCHVVLSGEWLTVQCRLNLYFVGIYFGSILGLLTVFKPKPRLSARTEENQNHNFLWA